MSAYSAAVPIPDVPPSYPIETAPRVDGVTSFPILLWDREWVIGYWGAGWRDWISGRPIEPTAWARLPSSPITKK